MAIDVNSILVGVATIYAGIYVGGPLYCDCDGTLFYDDATPSWVALDVKLYEAGWAKCGDIILLKGDGWAMTAQALDAGPLYKYYIEDLPDLPIIVDIPTHLAPFEGLSTRVEMINTTGISRAKKGDKR